ncbi:MAG: metalloregulator ArsR/SmtB family transcription factor [Chloroflexi bacterium]|nr:metalloregulator ArsR/SmtB family transcription factor [Chloroflexota bacterium]MDA1145584.1 metalloregulator ArsR/SmtB family transcription factor [Chloroflexota bacterium]
MNEPTQGSPLSALTGSDPLLAGELRAGELACVTEAFRALSDPTRVRLLSMISARNGDACVHELVDGLELSQPTVSHHLKVLREAGLVTSKRHASNVYYRVDPWAVSTLGRMLGPQPVVDGGDAESSTGDAGSRPKA